MELVRTEKLALRFGGVVGADDIDFSLHEGERLAVIGANGAGKTTFINICTGFLKPQAGRVFFAGQDITGLPRGASSGSGLGARSNCRSSFWSTRSGSAWNSPPSAAAERCPSSSRSQPASTRLKSSTRLR
jgi:ABC-type branched-subunit amino acid transport system ATPase component